jgi:hypothetical protein
VTRADGWRGRLAALSPRQLPLLPKILAAFLIVLALATLLTQLFETRLVRQQLDEHARDLFREQADVFDRRLEEDAARTGLLMRQFLEARFGTEPGTVTPTDLVVDLTDPGKRTEARTALGTLRRATGLQFGGIVDVNTGEVAVALARRATIADPGAEVAAAVLATPGSSQRVVPLAAGGDGARFGLAHVLPVGRVTASPVLHVIGDPLNDQYARGMKE